MNSPCSGENSKKSPNPSFQLIFLSIRGIIPSPAASLHNFWRGGHGIDAAQLEDGGKAVIPPQEEVGSTKAQQDQVILFFVGINPRPLSLPPHGRIPAFSGRHLDPRGKAAEQTCQTLHPHGQSLFPSPAHSASAEFDRGVSIFAAPSSSS